MHKIKCIFRIILLFDFILKLLHISPLESTIINASRSRNPGTGHNEVRLYGDMITAWESGSTAFKNYEDLWNKQLARKEISPEEHEERMLQLIDNRHRLEFSKIALLGPNEDVGIGIIGESRTNFDLIDNKDRYERLYKKMKKNQRKDILLGKYGGKRQKDLRKLLMIKGINPSKIDRVKFRSDSDPVKMAAFSLDRAHRKFDQGPYAYLGAYRDQILQFHVGMRDGNGNKLKPRVRYLEGNLYTDGIDNGASYALKATYGRPNYFGPNPIPIVDRTPGEAKEDHQLAMLHNTHESVSKRDFFVTEDFHGYTFTEDGQVSVFQHRPEETADRKMQRILNRKQLPREIWMTLKKKGMAQLEDTPEFQRTREQKLWQNQHLTNKYVKNKYNRAQKTVERAPRLGAERANRLRKGPLRLPANPAETRRRRYELKAARPPPPRRITLRQRRNEQKRLQRSKSDFLRSGRFGTIPPQRFGGPRGG